MIAACTGFGAGYQPTNANFDLVSMNTLLTEVDGLMDGVQTDLVPWKNKVADRDRFGIAAILTRLNKILDAIGEHGDLPFT